MTNQDKRCKDCAYCNQKDPSVMRKCRAKGMQVYYLSMPCNLFIDQEDVW